MIVTFKTKASGDLIYFKEAAVQLLQLMGRDDKIPSALYAEDVSAALAKLQQGLAAIADKDRAKAEQAGNERADSEQDSKAQISLNTRALPLLEMLQKAQKKQCPVSWE
ncbi:DUF1840 domain-containing protein [Rheinheimera sp. YQF-2]|uniref:DUF1840 domain-containing protein n=1 Tax=Rheinheimera lutimaris TaxID=2740584 RepID=A0A7Y5AQ35_9GAMM|nr:DUF1840 domain-containing protein [Rheinheimera lutimaris]NRQ42438.1 DUF1840 domain-containing protein [Rheinheimera lutimaris]